MGTSQRGSEGDGRRFWQPSRAVRLKNARIVKSDDGIDQIDPVHGTYDATVQGVERITQRCIPGEDVQDRQSVRVTLDRDSAFEDSNVIVRVDLDPKRWSTSERCRSVQL